KWLCAKDAARQRFWLRLCLRGSSSSSTRWCATYPTGSASPTSSVSRGGAGLERLGERGHATRRRPALAVGPHSTWSNGPASTPPAIEARRKIAATIAELGAGALTEVVMFAAAGCDNDRMHRPVDLVGDELLQGGDAVGAATVAIGIDHD